MIDPMSSFITSQSPKASYQQQQTFIPSPISSKDRNHHQSGPHCRNESGHYRMSHNHNQQVDFQNRRMFSPSPAMQVSSNIHPHSGRHSSRMDSKSSSIDEKRIASLRRNLFRSVETDWDSFIFMKYAKDNYTKPKRPLLPPLRDSRKTRSTNRAQGNCEYTLVLDLDETLIHASVSWFQNSDFSFFVGFGGQRHRVHAKKRPGLKEFLEKVSQMFECVLFTASQECYAGKILDLIDPEKKYFKYRLFRNSCIEVQGNYVKDLRVLGRDLRKVILVDNSPICSLYQQSNIIPIPSWFNDEKDPALQWLVPILKRLKAERDVRPLLREWFKMEKLIMSIRPRPNPQQR